MSFDPTAYSGDAAIIGMSCLFPGSDGPDRYWFNICAAQEQIGDPVAAWEAARYLNAEGPTKITTAKGGFLGDLYRFDPAALGVMPSSVDGQEPDQFLALQAAKLALGDSGYLADDYDHEKTGIILGHSTYLNRGNAAVVQHGVVLDQTIDLLRQLVPDAPESVLAQLRAQMLEKLPGFNSDMAPGLVPNVMSGRIANKLDLRGPNYLIDAACASSLLSVQSAMSELRTGRSNLMLAGGVNAAIPAEVNMVFTQLGALSPSGAVRSFGEAGDGTLLSEGLGIVVLKRLEDAQADGDRIYATVRGVGQSSDGRGAGLLAPRLEGEILAVRRAYEDAGMAPAGVGLIEAHGTGIPLGDKTEVTALRTVFGARENDFPTMAIGSVKSLIGHTIPAAGMAGLIKATMALHHRSLPPTICGEVRAENGMHETPLYANTQTRPWIQPQGKPRLAAVNAFGFGGINTHAILQEAPEGSPQLAATDWTAELCTLSAATPAELADATAALLQALEGHDETPLSAVAAALAARCTDAPARLAIVASSLNDLRSKLGKALSRLRGGKDSFRVRSGIYAASAPLPGKVAFIFPGEGAQYSDMLSDTLRAFPAAREWFDFWDDLYIGQRDIPPSAHVFPPTSTLSDAAQARLTDGLFTLEIGSESVFVASQALLAVAREVGLRPDAVMGHSSGEHSALRAAGIMGSDDWSSLKARIRDLNRLYRQMDEATHDTEGALLTVGAVARERVMDVALEHGLELALDNCYHQSVVYGPDAAIEAAAGVFRAEGGMCARLPFARPYHTEKFAPVADMVEGVYRAMTFRPADTPIYSCATAAPMPDDPAEIQSLAARQWKSRVRFIETVEAMYADGVRHFVEIGPSSNLTGFVEDVLKGKDILAVSMDSRRQPSLTHLTNTLARLWVAGVEMDTTALFANRRVAAVDLDAPAPKQRKRAFPNVLPVIRLSEDEVAPLRAALRPPAAVSSPAQPVTEGPLDEPAAPDMAADLDPAMTHHFDLMNRFLGVQQSVLGAAVAPDTADAPAPATAPLHFLHRIIEHSSDTLVAECDVDIETDTFLRDHVLYTTHVSDIDPSRVALPVVPLAVSMEMLAEAACALAPGLMPVRLEDVKTLDWVLVEDGYETLTLRAKTLGTDAAATVVHAQVCRDDTVLMEARVVMAAASQAPAPLGALAAPKPPVWRDDELYTTGMFHGPLFHAIASLTQWDETGLDAALADTPLAGFSADCGPEGLVLNPVLLDAVGHVTAFWIAQHKGTDFSSFPSSIDRIDLIDARREDTSGMAIRGRLNFEGGTAEMAKFLVGDFEVCQPDGTPILAARGWRDRFFRVPNSFYTARYKPREGWYGEDVTPLFYDLPSGSVVWAVPGFPDGFLTDAGGIWQRVISRTMLSPSELDTFQALPPRPARRAEWLLGRIAMKEAARTWIYRAYGQLLLPADLDSAVTGDGKPFLTGIGLEALGPMPQVSISHADGEAVAVASNPDVFVGIDLEDSDRVRTADLLAGAFSDAEQALLSAAGNPAEQALRGWCAKEAAAKCLGTGLTGRPKSFQIVTLDSVRNLATVDAPEYPGIQVRLATRGRKTLALAVS